MEYIDEIKGPLNAMLSPARWKGLRRNEVDRVITSLVDAWLYKYPPQWYLQKIINILALQENLEAYVPDRYENETDQNIREFLHDLALEIERQYPKVARSGRHAKIQGHWISEACPGKALEIITGSNLPYVNGREVIWELKESLPCTPTDALLDEFQKYYHRKTMKNKIKYEDTMYLAYFSILRFKKKYSERLTREIAGLLEAMASDKNHSMHRDIELRTEHDFTSNDHRWTWYVGLLNDIRHGLTSTSNPKPRQSIKPVMAIKNFCSIR